VTVVLVSLVGKDIMYTAVSTVISFTETVQTHKGQIRLLMMVKGHRYDFKCQQLLHWRTLSLNQPVLVATLSGFPKAAGSKPGFSVWA